MTRGRIGPRARSGLLALAFAGTLTLSGCHTGNQQPSIEQIDEHIKLLSGLLESEPFPTSRYFLSILRGGQCQQGRSYR